MINANMIDTSPGGQRGSVAAAKVMSQMTMPGHNSSVLVAAALLRIPELRDQAKIVANWADEVFGRAEVARAFSKIVHCGFLPFTPAHQNLVQASFPEYATITQEFLEAPLPTDGGIDRGKARDVAQTMLVRLLVSAATGHMMATSAPLFQLTKTGLSPQTAKAAATMLAGAVNKMIEKLDELENNRAGGMPTRLSMMKPGDLDRVLHVSMTGGISTFLPQLDGVLPQGVMPRGGVGIVYGGTGAGKTRFLLNLAVRAAENGIPVLFVEQDTPLTVLAARIKHLRCPSSIPLYVAFQDEGSCQDISYMDRLRDAAENALGSAPRLVIRDYGEKAYPKSTGNYAEIARSYGDLCTFARKHGVVAWDAAQNNRFGDPSYWDIQKPVDVVLALGTPTVYSTGFVQTFNTLKNRLGPFVAGSLDGSPEGFITSMYNYKPASLVTTDAQAQTTSGAQVGIPLPGAAQTVDGAGVLDRAGGGAPPGLIAGSASTGFVGV